jgi:hypothetical protein
MTDQRVRGKRPMVPRAPDRGMAVRHLSFGHRDRGLHRDLRGDYIVATALMTDYTGKDINAAGAYERRR